MISKKQTFYLSQEVLAQEIDGESILLDMSSEKYFGLNDVGSQILSQIQKGSNLETITNHLLTIYNVEEKQLKIDIIELLQQLLDKKIISLA